jgi:hypothetical protein
MRRTAFFAIAIFIILAAESPVNAEFTAGLIDLDFKFTTTWPVQTGPAVVGSAGDVWNTELNVFAPGGALNLTTGIASNGVSYSASGVTSAIVGGPGFMFDGYTVSPGNTMTIIIAGLSPFQPYDLYFYSGLPSPARSTTFIIAGSSLTSTIVGSQPFPIGFVEGTNYVHFEDQPADFAGQIAITVQGTGGNSGATGGLVSGFQITPVPEPATNSLIAEAVCCIALAIPSLRFCRKHRRQ